MIDSTFNSLANNVFLLVNPRGNIYKKYSHSLNLSSRGCTIDVYRESERFARHNFELWFEFQGHSKSRKEAKIQNRPKESYEGRKDGCMDAWMHGCMDAWNGLHSK